MERKTRSFLPVYVRDETTRPPYCYVTKLNYETFFDPIDPPDSLVFPDSDKTFFLIRKLYFFQRHTKLSPNSRHSIIIIIIIIVVVE